MTFLDILLSSSGLRDFPLARPGWEASFWGQRSERCPSWPWYDPGTATAVCRCCMCYEVRGLESIWGWWWWYNTEHQCPSGELMSVISSFLLLLLSFSYRVQTLGLMASLFYHVRAVKTEWPVDNTVLEVRLMRHHKLFISWPGNS